MIETLDLSNNRLEGDLPQSVYDIPFLRALIVRKNPDLVISFRNIEEARYLQTLVVSDTTIESFDGMQFAPRSLQEFHMTGCGLDGPFPWEVLEVRSLVKLYANYNYFYGRIPEEIGNLERLEELYLYENNLEGRLPEAIGYLTELRVLVASNNDLSGPLPEDELNNMANLNILALANNNFRGRVPAFDNLSELRQLFLQYNQFDGEIPQDFLWSAPKQELVVVDLSHNFLSGTFTAIRLAQFERLNIDLEENRIEKIDVNLCREGGWLGGNVGTYGCDAILCPVGSYAPEGRRTDSNKCERCESAEFMGSTHCNGLQKAVLADFYDALNGDYWAENNWFGEDYDEYYEGNECEFDGIECDQDGNVVSIMLSGYGLSGTPPGTVFSLPYLEILDLSNNFIQFKFDGIFMAKNLRVLDVSSTGLRSLENIDQLGGTSITELYLNSNSIDSTIPDDIYDLETLENLMIAHNMFHGPVSPEIGNLVNLVRFNAYGNDLTGRIPGEFVELAYSLRELILSENDFSGVLPEEFNEMANLETLAIRQRTNTMGGLTGQVLSFYGANRLSYLDLSSNSLSGELPSAFMENSTALGYNVEVYLSDNQIEGDIPGEWERFWNLTLDLSDNKIDSIPEFLCEIGGWQQGLVGYYEGNCNVILCETGTFNTNGRQTEDDPCMPCDDAVHMGSTSCGDIGDDELWWILEILYATTNGPEWENNDGWLSSTDPCDGWYGITCDKDKTNIVSIDLSSNGLYGIPTPLIFNIPRLSEINFSDNAIDFDFTGIDAADDLRILYLSNTQVGSIEGIGEAKGLTELHLTGNYLRGPIPDELFDLVHLKGLFLNYNKFNGRLSKKIGQLTKLEELYMLENDLTGQIPAAIGNLKEIKTLAISENNFWGTIPSELNLLKNIETLAIQGEGPSIDDFGDSRRRRKAKQVSRRNLKIARRKLRQDVSGLTGPLPALDGLSKLSGLYLGYNSLTGPIPFNFLSGIDDKTKRINIELEGNSLSGILPSSLTQFDEIELFVGGNKFTGVAPGLCRMTKWLDGDVETFDCDAIMCPVNTYSKWGRHDKDNTCTPCEESFVAPFVGSFSCISEEEVEENYERTILRKIYESLYGAGWYTQTSWNNDDVSICEWHGVTCMTEKNSVQALHLPSNGLSGMMPSEVFDLPNLVEFGFAGNDVDMNFDNIGSASKLEYLNIDSTDIKSLSGIEKASSLAVLHASKIGLTSFPLEIISLTGLEVLYLSYNKFESMIPDLSGLVDLASIQCHSCGLKGEIPEWFGNLENLQYISLPGNMLTGEIPALSKTLRYLDLSDQAPRGGGLTGDLPSFSDNVNLQELYLSKNKLSGPFPENFLQAVESDLVIVDLRKNEITGTVPDFARDFDSFTLLLADNKISAISDNLCNEPPEEWNEGDMRMYGCNGLMCEPGYYSPIGRVTDSEDYECSPCDDDTDTDTQQYYGSTTCGTSSEVQALEAIYYALGGPDWENNDGWMENDLFCLWYGIECDMAGEVIIGVDLSDNNLIGETPVDIFSITSLRYLNLKSNAISFDFDGIENLSQLVNLNLSEIGLTSVAGIGAASSLTDLHLTGNELTDLPNDFFNLVNLERLFMNYNKIGGQLSSRIGQLTALREIFMFRNKLVGKLPSEIGNLTNLRYLALGENDFTGALPSSLSTLKKIEVIALQHYRSGANADSSYTGGFTGAVPAFDNNPNLRKLYLSSHKLNGNLSNLFLRGINDKDAEIEIDLSKNEITGSLPSSLKSFSKLQLYLAGNRMTDLDQGFCDLRDWMGGEVYENGCDAILCPIGTYNMFGRQTNEGPACEPCPFTYTAPYLGSTSCTPDSTDYNEREILIKFYKATDGQNWLDADNWLEDDISICDWHGIFCVTKDGVKSVSEIHLPSNKLQGTVPPQIFDLQTLTMLNIRDNKIDVELYAMSENPAISDLYLDFTSISSLKGVGRAKELKTLHVQENNFHGASIPEELYSLKKLKHLYMSDSNIGGGLSPSIGNMEELVEFYCHANDLEGEIPEEITQLRNLEVLVLSENRFVGPLPENLSNLSALQSLFIDSFTHRSAGLSGPLPSFDGMPELKQIYLNENSLTGTIPDNFLSDDLSVNRGLASLSRLNEKITVGLMGNRIEGSIPASLAAFQKLDIDLSDNLITGIDSELCDNDAWMGSDVGSYGCDAILCPPGWFNQYGRQTNDRNSCKQCEGTEQFEFFGATQCQAEVKKREREILEQFHIACGGENWKNKDKWLEDDTDICHWFGVSCSNGGSVDSILLGSNNLVGTPPRELFELENLKYLWLYSNPMDFSFQGIGRAKRLSSLLLDSTNLSSLNGIGDAYQLTDLDIRFNKINTLLPKEISNLVNLETLSLSDNQFTGSLPTFSRMHRLKSLRVANNKITGNLPSFASNGNLKTIDLSDNMISGVIYTTFLENVDTNTPIYIDLSRNRIEGNVPGELSRFEDMTIYLKDNFILGIDDEICQMDEWNGNDVASHGCDAILCPPGTYAPGKGRESLGGSNCVECEEATFYGQSICVDLQDHYSSSSSKKVLNMAFVAIMGGVTLFAML